MEHTLVNGGDFSWNGMKGKVVTPAMEIRRRDDSGAYPYPRGCLWFRDALGNKVFLKTKDRHRANAFVEQFYGKNKYRLCGEV